MKLKTFLLSSLLYLSACGEQDKFADIPGAQVYASREEGKQAMIEKAKNDKKETTWLFLPEYSLWIYTADSIGNAEIFQDTKTVESILDTVYTVEFWQTHDDAEYATEYDSATIAKYGPALYFVPTGIDVLNIMYNVNSYKDHTLSSSIASSTGVLTMRSDIKDFKLNSHYAVRAMKDYCDFESQKIIKHLRGTPYSELEDKVASYDGDLQIEYEQ